MKNVMNNFKDYSVYLGIFFMTLGFTSCSDDDDGVIDEPDPTGSIVVDDEQTLSGNTLTVQSITVGQDSWLAAVDGSDATSNDFIADPVMLNEGTNTDVELTFNENAISDDGSGQEITLKLYSDNPAMGGSNVLTTETITVFAEGSGEAAFSDFDENSDNQLDRNEVPNTYQNNFEEWDADGDGSLNNEEFYGTVFSNTDADDDDGINEEEWTTGLNSMFGNRVEEGDFATFDADGDGILDSNEWNEGFADSEWFQTYDGDDDDMVTETEWDEGLFGDWDTDDDDLINEDEYNVYSPYVWTW